MSPEQVLVTLEVEIPLPDYLVLVEEARLHRMTEDEFVHQLVVDRRKERT